LEFYQDTTDYLWKNYLTGNEKEKEKFLKENKQVTT
jgi:hypothetical protein